MHTIVVTWSTKESEAKVTHLIVALRIYYTQAEAIHMDYMEHTHMYA